MLQPKRFHLGWFVNFTVNAWNDTWADSNGPDWTGGFYVDMARALERACFDYMILEDTCMVSEAYVNQRVAVYAHGVVDRLVSRSHHLRDCAGLQPGR